MANTDSEISRNIAAIRSAVYGKDIRKAIADAIEICYNYINESSASTAIDKARAAVETLQQLIGESQETMESLHDLIDDAQDTVIISEDKPTQTANKIWIKPQFDTEYRVASYDAYSVLWEYVNELNNTYNNGHGGIVSITQDTEYIDDSEIELSDDSRRIRRYVVTYADGTQNDFLITNAVGPIDTIQDNGVVVEYAKGVINDGVFVRTPPVEDEAWSDTIPDDLDGSGEYLWTRTKNYYRSGNVSTIYALSKFGTDGKSNGVTSIQIGADGEIMTGDVTLPLDQFPVEGNFQNFVSSGGVYAAIDNIKHGDVEFTGAVRATNLPPETNNDRIATTKFVHDLMLDRGVGVDGLFNSPELTGEPTAPTVENVNDSSNRIATTEFVQDVAYAKAEEFVRTEYAYPNFGLYNTTRSFSSGNSFTLVITIPDGSSHFISMYTTSPSSYNAAFLAFRGDDPESYTVVSSLGTGSSVSIVPTLTGVEIAFSGSGRPNKAHFSDVILNADEQHDGVASSAAISISVS